MQCTVCKYPESHVVSTDYNDLKNRIERRRECLKCGGRFTTHEHLRDKKPPNDSRFPIRNAR